MDELEIEQEEITPPPQLETYGFVTQEALAATLAAFGEQLVDRLTPKQVRQIEEDPEWAQALKDQGFGKKDEIVAEAEARAYDRYLNDNKTSMVKDIISEVVGDLGTEAADAVREELANYNARTIANIRNDEKAKKTLLKIAKAARYEANEKAAPTSSTTGSVGRQTSEEARLTAEFMKDYDGVPGFTKDDAIQMAKVAVKGAR